MSTDAQLDANRANAQHSTGPRTHEGRLASSANAVKLGLFSTNNCIFPGEEDEYAAFRDGLWSELRPATPLQEVHAAEIVRAAWRLRRCAMAEERLGWRCEVRQDRLNNENGFDMPPADPSISDHTMKEQAAVDRARAQAQNSMRRAQAALEKLQNEPNRAAIAASSPAPQPVLQNEANSEPEKAAAVGSSLIFFRNEPRPPASEPQADRVLAADLQNEPNLVRTRAA